jgi:hypothetical protein
VVFSRLLSAHSPLHFTSVAGSHYHQLIYCYQKEYLCPASKICSVGLQNLIPVSFLEKDFTQRNFKFGFCGKHMVLIFLYLYCFKKSV